MEKIRTLIKELDKLKKLPPREFWMLKLNQDKFDKTKIVTLTLEEENVKCGHCDSKDYVKNGRRNDLQRYKCKCCGRTFNQLTGTPLARLRMKGRWLNFSECLNKGYSVRYAASQVGVDKNTSFAWRHKFLKNSNKIFAKKLKGAVEIKETSFKYSEKGAKVIRHPERFGEDVFVLAMINRSRLSSTPLIEYFDQEHIQMNNQSKFCEDVICFSDTKKQTMEFIKNNKLKHLLVNNQSKTNYKHLNNVLLYIENLHYWMKRFRGVATKYLHNYLSWYRELDEYNQMVPKEDLLKRAKSSDSIPYRPIID
jgi:transposase-like protein